MHESELPQIVTDFQDSPRIGSARSSVSKAKGSEMMAVWGMLLILALAGTGYAIHVALRDEPPAPEPVAKVVPEPEPVAEPAPPRRVVATRRKTAESRPQQQPVVTERVLEKVVETPKEVVDPLEGFENGKAFDNPPSPGKYGRRTSGLTPPR